MIKKTLKRSIALLSSIVATLIFSNAAMASATFWFPERANEYGYQKLIFIDATNANQFCEEEGYNQAVGGTIYCGEDESSYVTYDWYQSRWEAKSTGSKNQCYPLFASIICD